MEGSSFADGFARLSGNIEGFVRGNHEVVRLALVCLFAEGHLLVEGVPGVAKTSLAKAIARSIGGAGQARIQFTPDLLPSDVTGGLVFRQDIGEFVFIKGPVFTNVLLADEINRSSPRTQSALLEVMAERQVTVDGKPRPVPEPFLCIATQNPIEHRGTFPLPEAQIDRFMMKLTMRPPEPAAELEVLQSGLDRKTAESAVNPVLSLEEIKGMIRGVRGVFVHDSIKEFILAIVTATRSPSSPDIASGVSPRAGIAMALAAQAYAKSDGRDFVRPDDVKTVAYPVLRHRLVLRRGSAAKDPDLVIKELLALVTVPGLEDAARVPRREL